MPGFEVSLPGCGRPVGVLPVPASSSAIIPTAFRYKPGDYDVSYLYNGQAYPEAGISYRLSLLYTFQRAQSLLGLIDGKQSASYLKIWNPAGCPKLSTSEVLTLERGLDASPTQAGR